MSSVYLIILGFALQVTEIEKGKLIAKPENNPILVARLKAADFIIGKFLLDEGKLKTDHKLIFSGRGPEEKKVWESHFMRDNFPKTYIDTSTDLDSFIIEDASKDTFENVLFIFAQFFKIHNPDVSPDKEMKFDIMLMTNEFHVRRSIYLFLQVYLRLKISYTNLEIKSLDDFLNDDKEIKNENKYKEEGFFDERLVKMDNDYKIENEDTI